MPKASWSIAVLIAAGLIQALPLPLPGAAALAQTRNPADWNSFFLSAPEMMYR